MWKTRIMAIANETCVSFCNQPRHILASLGTPLRQRGKCHMDEKRIQCLSNALQHVPICLQPFTSYSEILVRNCNFFLPLAFNALVGSVPIGIPGKKFGPQKTRIMGLVATRQWRQFDDRLSRFDTMPACDRQTGRRTAYIPITCAVWLTHV